MCCTDVVAIAPRSPAAKPTTVLWLPSHLGLMGRFQALQYLTSGGDMFAT
jgi:hypothetical protein